MKTTIVDIVSKIIKELGGKPHIDDLYQYVLPTGDKCCAYDIAEKVELQVEGVLRKRVRSILGGFSVPGVDAESKTFVDLEYYYDSPLRHPEIETRVRIAVRGFGEDEVGARADAHAKVQHLVVLLDDAKRLNEI